MSYMDTKFCKICDEEYNWAAPECPGCAHRRYSEEQQAEIKQLRSKVASLEQLLATAEAFHDVAVKERDYARMVLANYQPHEDPRRTEYVVGLEREVERLRGLLREACDLLPLVEAGRIRIEGGIAEVERLRAEILDVAQRASNAVTFEHLRAEEARAEVERLRDLLKEAHKELSTIEAITVSPSDTDGLIDLCRRMEAAIHGAEQKT